MNRRLDSTGGDIAECDILAVLYSPAMRAIAVEVVRARRIHPKWPEDVVYQAAILGEEAGEVTKAALDHQFKNQPLRNVLDEAIQTAAMGVRMLEGG